MASPPPRAHHPFRKDRKSFTCHLPGRPRVCRLVMPPLIMETR
jgi:hypothetical protein